MHDRRPGPAGTYGDHRNSPGPGGLRAGARVPQAGGLRRACRIASLSPVTHLLLSWSLADAAGLTARQRLVVAPAGVAPDLDGLGLVADLGARALHLPDPDWYGRAHHMLLHGLPGALLIAGLAALATPRDEAAGGGRTGVALWAFAVVHLHLLCDLLGSAGPLPGQRWPIAYLSPLSATPVWTWSGQWLLNGWQNVTLSCALLGWVVVRALRAGRSPLEVVAPRLHGAFVEALRRCLARAG